MLRSITCRRKSRTRARLYSSLRKPVARGSQFRVICEIEPFASEVMEAIQRLGGLDIVVCNPGRQQSKASILDISDEDFDATMKTNIYAPFYSIKAALPHLSEGSCIIGTTSEPAYDPSPDLYDYAQTKAATMNYVKSLAKQLGGRGIRVNAVAPGPIWTPLQISGGASEKNTSISVARPRWAGLDSLRNWPPSTSSWPRTMRALPQATYTAPAADKGNPSNVLPAALPHRPLRTPHSVGGIDDSQRRRRPPGKLWPQAR